MGRSTPSLVPPITLEQAVPLIAGELSPSPSFSRRTAPDAVAGWSFEAHSVPHSANVSDSQQWKHSRRARLLSPSRSSVPPSPAPSLFLPPSPALRFQRHHPSLHLKLRGNSPVIFAALFRYLRRYTLLHWCVPPLFSANCL
ncbi:uncharacterized protein DS421_5g162510 [Arachis hypogaea]|nr:uncharacterized protein DS421_5g162510 [Arachis hypogaea]